MSDLKLKVTPDQLKSKAREIQSKISDFERSWAEMTRVIQNSKGYWVGDASNAHQKAFKECQEDVTRIVKRLKEHPDDLLVMAGVYEKSELEATSLAQALPADVIF